jgi:hypothetical protein
MRWVSGPFYKVICRVADEQFEKVRQCPDHVIITESVLGDEDIAVAFQPREEWPKIF